MAKKSPRQRLSQRALLVVGAVVLLGFGAGTVRLGYLQLVASERYRLKAEENQLQDSAIPAQRGNIYDTNMKILAQSANVWKVYMDPSKFPNDLTRELVSRKLSDVLDVPYETILEKAKMSSKRYLDIKRRIEFEEKERVSALLKEKVTYYDEKHKEQEVGINLMVGIDIDVKRYYPHNSFASGIIGFAGNDDIGRSGLELRYNDDLAGTPGRRITARNGRSDDMPLQFETMHDAVQGKSLVLTVDEVIQRFLEKALEQVHIDTQSKAAYGIVMDVKTGAILGMAGTPNYDLNNPQTIQDEALKAQLDAIAAPADREKETNNAKFSMWRNRGISDIYDPGSVFKIVVAAAAIEEKSYPLNTRFTCTGALQVKDRTYHCHKTTGHGTQTYTECMMNSCNPFFITLGQSLGVERFGQYFEAFGFTEKTGIDLPAEAKPVPGLTYHPKETMSTVDLASMSFGQSFQASPIQIINMIASIGNGGKLMTPYLVAKELDENGNTIKETKPTVKRQVVSEATAKQVAEMMRMVVAGGTGKNAYVPGYSVAGKTGTSQKLNKPGYYVTSFACFAPAEDARLAILITIDEPVGAHGGGQIAAPVAAKVMEDSLLYLNVKPNYTQEELALLYKTTPGLVNKTVASAKAELINAGLNPKVVGDGEKVISQIPAEGKTVSKGGVVILYTQKNSKTEKTKVPNFIGLSINEVTNLAASRSLNIKISGNTLQSGELVAYKQSEPLDTQVEVGSYVTVYFKSNKGVTDFSD